jgi:hypothetical protein
VRTCARMLGGKVYKERHFAAAGMAPLATSGQLLTDAATVTQVELN